MQNVVIVFTADREDGSYIEGAYESIESAKEDFVLEKVIDGAKMDSWRELQKEIKNPSVENDMQFAYVSKVVHE